jgi:hypothetical protein
MILVCNNPDGAREVLDELRDYRDPVAQSRMVRLHGRPAPGMERLREDPRWHSAVALASQLGSATNLNLDLDKPE